MKRKNIMSQRHFVFFMLTNCKFICTGYCEHELARKYWNPICTFGTDFFVRCDLVSFFSVETVKALRKESFFDISCSNQETSLEKKSSSFNSVAVAHWLVPCKCSSYVHVAELLSELCPQAHTNYLLIYLNYVLVLLQSRFSVSMWMFRFGKLKATHQGKTSWVHAKHFIFFFISFNFVFHQATA